MTEAWTEGRGLGGHHRVRQANPERLVLLLALPAVVQGRPSYAASGGISSPASRGGAQMKARTSTAAKSPPAAESDAGGSSSRHGFVSRLAHFFWGVGQLKPCILRRGRRRRAGRDRLRTRWRLARRRRTRGGRRTFGGRTEGIFLGGHHRVRQVNPERLVLLLALPAVVKGRPSYAMRRARRQGHAHAQRSMWRAHIGHC